MSAALDLLRTAANLTSGLPAAADTCRALLAHGIAGQVVVGVVDVAHPIDRLLRESVVAPDLFLHGTRAETLQAGPADRDCRARRRVWPQMRQGADFRMRRLDTLYAGWRDVALLVIAGHPSPAAILLGAADLLSGARPLVLIDLCGISPSARAAELSAIAALLPEWTWFDSWLLAVAGGDDATRLLDEFAETVFVLSPRGASFPSRAGGRRAVAWAGWRMPVAAAQPARVVIKPDGLFRSEGFYGLERDGDYVWRWTGPDRAARAFIPMPSYGTWAVQVEVFSWGVLGGARDVQVALNGGCLQQAQGAEGVLTLGTATLLPGDMRRYLQLDLVCARMRPGTYEDPRTLGLCLSGVMLERRD